MTGKDSAVGILIRLSACRSYHTKVHLNEGLQE